MSLDPHNRHTREKFVTGRIPVVLCLEGYVAANMDRISMLALNYLCVRALL
jgi:hypothetical protein